LDRGLQLESFKVLPKETAGEGGKTRLLVLHGTGDHVNAYEATKAYVDRCSGLSDKELKSYDGWYHNMHAEPGDDKLDFANHVSGWILQRSGSEDSKSKL